MKIVWKRQEGQYQNGHDAFCGPIKVGSVFWGSTIRGDERPHKVSFTLPQMKKNTDGFADESDAKGYLERRVEGWFKAAMGEQ